jgi:hypothetical protein
LELGSGLIVGVLPGVILGPGWVPSRGLTDALITANFIPRWRRLG